MNKPEGTRPKSRLVLRLRCLSEVREPREEGREPTSLFLGKLRETTRALMQVTPFHEHGSGSEEFQFKREFPGSSLMEVLKARRANPSPFRAWEGGARTRTRTSTRNGLQRKRKRSNKGGEEAINGGGWWFAELRKQ